MVQDVEGRLEVAAAERRALAARLADEDALDRGLLDLTRLGNNGVDAAVIGQNLSFAAPGKSNVLGVYGRVGADYLLSEGVTAFAAADFAVMNDNGFTGTGRIGLRAKF